METSHVDRNAEIKLHVERRPRRAARPNLFILGAGKSGTTTLYSYLCDHPEIFMSPVKEPSFFCDIFQVVANPVDYLALFEGATSQKWIGEASHVYFTCPRSAALLQAFAPEARFILILRNPADRAYSLYQHMARAGDEWAGTFEKALDVEEKRVRDPWFERHNPQYYYNFLYFRSGLYAEQIERYFDWFERDRFLFVTFDEFKTDCPAVLRKVGKFLDVEPCWTPNLRVRNPGGGIYSAPLQFFLKHRLRPLLAHVRIPKVARWLMTQNRTGGKAPTLNPRTRQELLVRYEPDIRKTAELTGLDLTAWLPATANASAASTIELRVA